MEKEVSLLYSVEERIRMKCFCEESFCVVLLGVSLVRVFFFSLFSHENNSFCKRFIFHNRKVLLINSSLKLRFIQNRK